MTDVHILKDGLVVVFEGEGAFGFNFPDVVGTSWIRDEIR